MTSYNLTVLFVQYDDSKYAGAFCNLERILKRHKLKVFYCIIDNKNDSFGIIKRGKNYIEIGGDNSCWEFSGWQKGVNILKSERHIFGPTFFINDSFQAHGRNIIECDYFPKFIHSKVFLSQSIAAGFIDEKRSHKHLVLHYDVSTWLRTNAILFSSDAFEHAPGLVAIDNDMLDRFLPKVMPAERNDFNDNHQKLFRIDAPLNDSMQEDIVTWLTQEWHSKFAIDDATWGFFRKKVQAILNEALLSARMREAGIEIVDLSHNSDYVDSSVVRRLLCFANSILWK